MAEKLATRLCDRAVGLSCQWHARTTCRRSSGGRAREGAFLRHGHNEQRYNRSCQRYARCRSQAFRSLLARAAATRRETVEHPFGTLKMRMGAKHFLMKTLAKVATEMALHVLAYNLTRVMNLLGIKPLLAAIRT